MAKLTNAQKMFLLKQVMIALCERVRKLNPKFKYVHFETHEDGWSMDDVLKHLVRNGTFKGAGHHRRSDIISAREAHIDGEMGLEDKARTTPAYKKLRQKAQELERQKRDLRERLETVEREMHEFVRNFRDKQNGREFARAKDILAKVGDYMENAAVTLMFEDSGDPKEMVKKLTKDINKLFKV